MQLNRLRGFHPRAPGVYPLEDTGEVEKQRIDSVALHRISCSCVGALSSVALFCCIFSFDMFFGIIRVYTVVFSDPDKLESSEMISHYHQSILFSIIARMHKEILPSDLIKLLNFGFKFFLLNFRE